MRARDDRASSTREPPVERVLDLLTLHMGADVMVAVKAKMRPQADQDALVDEINAIEARLQERFPQVQWIFFEPDVALSAQNATSVRRESSEDSVHRLAVQFVRDRTPCIRATAFLRAAMNDAQQCERSGLARRGIAGLDDILCGGLTPAPPLPGRRRARLRQDHARDAVPARRRAPRASRSST